MVEQVTCKECGTKISTTNTFYIMRIEMFAGVGELIIDEETLHKDHIEEMKHLLNEMADADVEELNDQVYEAYVFELCPSCRDAFHTKLKQKKLFDYEM